MTAIYRGIISVQWSCLLVAAFGFIAAAGVSTTAYGQALNESTFVDVAAQIGLKDQRESFSVSWVDYNSDGWTDLWLGVHGGGAPPRLYVNQGDGTFRKMSSRIWADGPPTGDMHGSAWADFDNDGDPDLMQVVGGGGGEGDRKESNYFFVNEDGTLANRADEMGLEYSYGRGRTPLWFDYDRDGYLDLLQTTEPRPAPPHALTRLFRQVPEREFVKANESAGLHLPERSGFAQVNDVSGGRKADLVMHGQPFPVQIYQGGPLPLKRVDTSLVQKRTRKYWVSDNVIEDLNGDLHPDFYMTRRRNASDMFLEGDSLLALRLQQLKPRHNSSRLTFQASGSVQLLNLFPAQPLAYPDEVHIGREGYTPEDTTLEWKPLKRKGQYLTLNPNNSANWGLDTSQTSGLLIGYDPEDTTWTVQTRSKNTFPIMIRTGEDIQNVSLTGPNDPRLKDAFWIYDLTKKRYVDRTGEAGLDHATSCTSVGAGDFDNDMDVDLYLSCAHLLSGLPNRLLENQGDGTFRAVPAAGGAEGATEVTGWKAFGSAARVAVADYDRDGFLDLLIPPTAAMLAAGQPVPAFPTTPLQLFRNTGNDNHWLEVDLTGTTSNADAIGARVDVMAGGVTQRRFQDGGVHHFVQDGQRLHFGLAQNIQVDTLTVRWPSGRTQSFYDIGADQIVGITEGHEKIDRSPNPDSGNFAFRRLGPTPFRSPTRFKLKVNRTQRVRVEVFNALGRRVAVLHDGRLARGAIKFLRFNAGQLASGVYFVRAQGETAVRTRKVIYVE
jgi:hypothetical protein